MGPMQSMRPPADFAARRLDQMPQQAQGAPQMPMQGMPNGLPPQSQAMAHANPNAAFMRQAVPGAPVPMANPNMPQMPQLPQQRFGMIGQRPPQTLADLAPNAQIMPFNGRY